MAMNIRNPKKRLPLALALSALLLFLFLFGQFPAAHNHALNQAERDNCPAYLIQTHLIQGLDVPSVPPVFFFLPETFVFFPNLSFIPFTSPVFSEHTRSPPSAA
jgi:hypothetical protein